MWGMISTSNLFVALTCSGATKAFKAGDHEAALRKVRRYRKFFRSDPRGYWLEHEMGIRTGWPPSQSPLALLREGWRRGPWFAPLAEALIHQLLEEDRRQPDPKWRVEAHRVVDQIVDLYGESYWSAVWRSELAQLEGDFTLARDHALLAVNAVEGKDDDGDLGLVKVAWSFLSIPGERDRAEELLLQAIAKYGRAEPHLYYGIAVEGRDPGLGQRHIYQARSMWPDDNFDRVLNRTRRLLEADQQRRSSARR